jgi:hypothetical protein
MNFKEILYFIVSFGKKNWKSILLVVLIILCFFSIRSCVGSKIEIKRQKHNIEASLDSVRYYKDKNGELYAEKLSYIATQKEMEKINSELSDNIKALDKKLLAALNAVVVIRDTIPMRDTLYINNEIPLQSFLIPIKDDILSANLGLTYHKNNSLPYLELSRFDYTIQLPVEVYFTKDFSVILKTTGKDNVTFNNVTSFIDPIFYSKPKQKRYGIGFSGGIGISPYNFVNGKWNVYAFPYIGVSINYNAISF